MNAVIYARFSSSRQTELSIEAQIRACQEYADFHNYDILDVYKDEAISGKSTVNRASYQKMLRHAKAGKFDIILIHKYDRIARNLADHINLATKLNEYNVQLIAVAQDFGDGKEAKMMKGIQWIMSEYYIDNLAEETRKGLKETALKGLHNGGYAPFGYDIKDQQYVINPVEAYYVKKMFENAILHIGYNDILAEMEKAGIRGKRGSKLTRTAITDILRNEKYTGTYIYSPVEEKTRSARRTKPNAIRIENAIPKIIDYETWKEVQIIMDGRKQNGKTQHRCSGLVYCECGSKMHLNSSTRKGHSYKRFCCYAKCGAKSLRIEVLDNMVDKYINAVLSAENRKLITKAMQEYIADEERMMKDFEETRNEKIAIKQAELNALTDNMTKADLPPLVIKELGSKAETLIKEIEKIRNMKPVKSNVPKIVDGWLDSLLQASQEQLPAVLIEKIVVKQNEVEFTSTLASLCLGNMVAGVHIHIPQTLPQLYFSMVYHL